VTIIPRAVEFVNRRTKNTPTAQSNGAAPGDTPRPAPFSFQSHAKEKAGPAKVPARCALKEAQKGNMIMVAHTMTGRNPIPRPARRREEAASE